MISVSSYWLFMVKPKSKSQSPVPTGPKSRPSLKNPGLRLPEKTCRNTASRVNEDLPGVFEGLERGEAVSVCEGAEVIAGGYHDEAHEAVAELDDRYDYGGHWEADHTQTRIFFIHSASAW